MNETCRECEAFQLKGKWAIPEIYKEFGVCEHPRAFPELPGDTSERRLWHDFPACRYFKRREGWEEKAAERLYGEPVLMLPVEGKTNVVQCTKEWLKHAALIIREEAAKAGKA